MHLLGPRRTRASRRSSSPACAIRSRVEASRHAAIGCYVILFFAAGVIHAAEPKRLTGRPWEDMDYGPFLTASIEAPSPRTNIACKGIAIRLGSSANETPNAAVLFDTDLLRCAAGWTGGFVALKGVVFDGEHWAYPAIQGRQQFGNSALPGWSHDGDFHDPREFPFGPLPRSRARWNGLYLHGDQVILALRVADADVLELPGFEKGQDAEAFTRTLRIGPSTNQLELQVAFEPGQSLDFVSTENLSSSDSTQPAASALARFSGNPVRSPQSIAPNTRPAANNAVPTATVDIDRGGVIAGIRAGPADLRWIATPDGQLRLRIPAANSNRVVTLLIGRATEKTTAAFASVVKRPAALVDFASLTRGGPNRWNQSVVTRGTPGDAKQPFALDTITWPDSNPWNSWMRFGGFDFFRDATKAAICTWSGDVWIVSGLDDAMSALTWRRFATGLYQPLGLRIVNDVIYVLGRDQITRLRDLNGDGEADFYENFNNDSMNTEHFHEFALDLQTDAAGNFYYMKGARHAREALHPHHGTFMRVNADGSNSEVLARGMRAPNGLLITPDGDGFTTDQEGFWLPANRINFLKPGSFQGNNWAWMPEKQAQGLRSARDVDSPEHRSFAQHAGMGRLETLGRVAESSVEFLLRRGARVPRVDAMGRWRVAGRDHAAAIRVRHRPDAREVQPSRWPALRLWPLRLGREQDAARRVLSHPAHGRVPAIACRRQRRRRWACADLPRAARSELSGRSRKLQRSVMGLSMD